MVRYLFIHAATTMVAFMIWITSTSLPGGEVGMTPFILGFVLIIQLFIGMVLALVFRKYLIERRQKIVGLTVYFILYELIFFAIDGQLSIINSFSKGWSSEVYAAYSLSSIIAYIVTLTILLTKELKASGTYHKD
jgi:TctA family transporter